MFVTFITIILFWHFCLIIDYRDTLAYILDPCIQEFYKKKTIFKGAETVKIAGYETSHLQKLISRKIWVTEKLPKFQTVSKNNYIWQHCMKYFSTCHAMGTGSYRPTRVWTGFILWVVGTQSWWYMTTNKTSHTLKN